MGVRDVLITNVLDIYFNKLPNVLYSLVSNYKDIAVFQSLYSSGRQTAARGQYLCGRRHSKQF